MKTYVFDFVEYGPIMAYSSHSHAVRNVPQGKILAKDEEELAAGWWSVGTAIEFYNTVCVTNGDSAALPTINHSVDRPAMVKLLWSLALAKSKEVPSVRKARAPRSPTSKRPGRKSEFADKRFRITKLEIPAREGTKRWKELKVMFDAGQEGIAYEDFISAGGRWATLKFGIDVYKYIEEVPA